MGLPLEEAMLPLEPGEDVVIEGLKRLPEFNGLRGTVQSFDLHTRRYDILLLHPVGPTVQRWAKVKRENLRVATLPQPPPFEPSLPTIGNSNGTEAWDAICMKTWTPWDERESSSLALKLTAML